MTPEVVIPTLVDMLHEAIGLMRSTAHHVPDVGERQAAISRADGLDAELDQLIGEINTSTAGLFTDH